MLPLVFATLGVRFLCDSGSGIGHDYRLPPPFGVSTAFFLQPLSALLRSVCNLCRWVDVRVCVRSVYGVSFVFGVRFRFDG